MMLTLYGSRPVLCVGWSGFNVIGLNSTVWESLWKAGTEVAEVAAPSGRLWLMNVNFCQARSPCRLVPLENSNGHTRRRRTHTHTHAHTLTHTHRTKRKDNPHLGDGWYGSKATHHFSISMSSHSAPSLYLSAPINLQLLAFLHFSCWAVLCSIEFDS